MSMVINLVEDHNIYLCEGGPVYNGGVQPTPITYLTQWKIVGNSEVHGSEIWSCGEYNATDGKYHILVQPQGGSIADIALTEPLRKVNDVADTIEFPSNTDGKALVTRNLDTTDMEDLTWEMSEISSSGYFRFKTLSITSSIKRAPNNDTAGNILCALYETKATVRAYFKDTCIGVDVNGQIIGYDPNYNQSNSAAAFTTHVDGVELIYELATPTTELIDAPQIEEADSYSMVISQGAKAVEWSSFETDSE